jgi:predicted O-methyltransferase YrrM
LAENPASEPPSPGRNRRLRTTRQAARRFRAAAGPTDRLAAREPTAGADARDASPEAAISGNLQASWAYAEQFIAEDEVLTTARAKAGELGCTPVQPGAGAALRLLAASAGARAVVEIGTGAGVGSVYLLRGMRRDGVLTTIDVEPEHHRAARETLAEAGVPSNRVRLISGRALDVLPRLTDAAYDLVFADADKKEYAGYLEQALRLLKPGGLVVFDNALWHDRVADPTQRDEDTTTIRELGKAVREDERLVSAMLAAGDGLLAAVKRDA